MKHDASFYGIIGLIKYITEYQILRNTKIHSIPMFQACLYTELSGKSFSLY